jgi:hypothetical protein
MVRDGEISRAMGPGHRVSKPGEQPAGKEAPEPNRPTAQDISASATAVCHRDAQAGAR